MTAIEVVIGMVIGGLAGSIGDNPVGWSVFGVLAVWTAVGALPVWAEHPRLIGFCRGVAVSFATVMVCVAVGVLSLGGRP